MKTVIVSGSAVNKFKKDYQKWEYKYNGDLIIEEMVKNAQESMNASR